MTLPDLATLPFNNYLNLNDSAFYHDYSATFRSKVQALAHSSAKYTLTVVDAYDLFADIFSRPAAYGFDANVTHASCLTGVYGEAPRSLCVNPDQYVFWDEYHVSTSGSLGSEILY
jgi:phospholipase/lecithinase/hemolysin